MDVPRLWRDRGSVFIRANGGGLPWQGLAGGALPKFSFL